MLLILVLVLLLIGLAPRWRYSRNWGYFPSGAMGAFLLVAIVLILVGRLNF